jgi:spermidine synthase
MFNIFWRKEKILFEKETKYNKIKVVDDGEKIKLILDDSYNTHSLILKGKVLSYSYWDICAFVPLLFGDKDDSFVVLGGGGGTISRIIKSMNKNCRVFNVDIDVEVFKVGIEFFNMPNENLVVSDFRDFINYSKKSFSHIIIDVFRNAATPFDIFRKEFWEKISEKSQKTALINLVSNFHALTVKEVMQKYFIISGIVKSRESSNYIVFGSKEIISEKDFEIKKEEILSSENLTSEEKKYAKDLLEYIMDEIFFKE